MLKKLTRMCKFINFTKFLEAKVPIFRYLRLFDNQMNSSN